MIPSCDQTVINSLWPSDATWPHKSDANTTSSNDFLPDGTKPLPELMLTNHQECLLAFSLGQFHWKCICQRPVMSGSCNGFKQM